MRAAQFMTADPLTVRPDTSIKEAAAVLVDRRITALPVVDDAGALVGIVAESDLLRGRIEPDPLRHARVAPADSGPLPHEVSQVMTTDPIALPESADESEFAALMYQRRIKSIPVVRDGRVVGIVSRRDLLRPLLRDDAAVQAEITSRLRSLSDDDWQVEVRGGSVVITGPPDKAELADVLARSVSGVLRVSVGGAVSPDLATDHAGLSVLTFDECLERLRSVPVGRLCFVIDGEPVVLPVNHGVDGSGVVFRTAYGSKLLAAEKVSTVAYEADSYESLRRYGWSVLVRGVAEVVLDDEDVARLERLGVEPWADAVERPMWVRITPREITGREIAR